ncbi:MAG: epoxyqueuosine reductase QueH [Planctomycetes bacterium]|nr:epoxyqueuosine reductase QueH [Planctomycetota bacterium]
MPHSDAILLHTCCAPCLAAARATLAGTPGGTLPPLAGIFFYNPNIHPLLEFRRRVKALRVYLERDRLVAEIDDDYGLGLYLREVYDPELPRPERCRRCYALRLRRTAREAADQGLAGFTTTLLASREQDRDLVAEEGRRAAAESGVEFYQADLRQFLPDEKMMRGIYKQQYCGCVFSEEERFRPTAKHLYFPDNDPSAATRPDE